MKMRNISRLLVLVVLTLLLSVVSGFQFTTGQEPYPDIGLDLEWSPDGTALAIFASNGLFIYDRNFQLLRYREQDNNNTSFGEWSSDGTKLLVGNQVWNADTLDTLFTMPTTPLGWNHNNSQLFGFVDQGKSIGIFDAKDANLAKSIPLDFQLESVSWSWDGNKFASAIGKDLVIIDADKTKTVRYSQPVSSIGTYLWSPDSQRIAYNAVSEVSSGTPGSIPTVDPSTAVMYNLHIADANTGQVLYIFDSLTGHLGLAWSEKTARLAGVASTGDIYIWDANTLTLLTASSISNRTTFSIAYSPYGGVLAIGIYPNANSQIPSTLQPTFESVKATTRIANNTVQLIIPEASLEYLNTIQSLCSQRSDMLFNFIVPQIKDMLNDYIEQVKVASTDQILPGCAADLIAVAEAIIAQPS
jgi:dipeptidyl aminopeptidase/acylaminoacyl peptidase